MEEEVVDFQKNAQQDSSLVLKLEVDEDFNTNHFPRDTVVVDELNEIRVKDEKEEKMENEGCKQNIAGAIYPEGPSSIKLEYADAERKYNIENATFNGRDTLEDKESPGLSSQAINVKLVWEDNGSSMASSQDLDEEQSEHEYEDDEDQSENEIDGTQGENENGYTGDDEGQKEGLDRCTNCNEPLSERSDKQTELNADASSKYQLCELICNERLENVSYACDLCAFFAVSKSELDAHRKERHSTFRPSLCDQCALSPGTRAKRKRSNSLRSRSQEGTKSFTCDKCNYSTDREPDLDTHKKEQHTIRPFACSQCDYSCWGVSGLRIHAETKHVRPSQLGESPDFPPRETHKEAHVQVKLKNVHKCNQCDYTSPNKRNFRQHVRGKHSTAKPYSCDQCSYSAKTGYRLNEHKATHSSLRQFTCSYCNYSTTCKRYLARHIKVKHGQLNSFVCNLCDYSTSYSPSLKKHMTVKHYQAEDLFACSECDYSTPLKESLKLHGVVHAAEKSFACYHCGFTSTSKMYLSRHIMRQHSLVKVFKCGQCDYSTGYEPGLNEHTKKKHSFLKFECDKCKYSTTSKDSFRLHRAEHPTEKPYACDHCQFTCTSKVYLSKHLRRLHSNVKLFKCKRCDYSSGYEPDWKYHMKKKHSR